MSQLYDLKDVVKNDAKIILTMNVTELLLGGFWFLKSLFVGSFLALGCFKILRNDFYGGDSIFYNSCDGMV